MCLDSDPSADAWRRNPESYDVKLENDTILEGAGNTIEPLASCGSGCMRNSDPWPGFSSPPCLCSRAAKSHKIIHHPSSGMSRVPTLMLPFSACLFFMLHRGPAVRPAGIGVFEQLNGLRILCGLLRPCRRHNRDLMMKEKRAFTVPCDCDPPLVLAVMMPNITDLRPSGASTSSCFFGRCRCRRRSPGDTGSPQMELCCLVVLHVGVWECFCSW